MDRTCPKCAAPVAEGDVFCGGCGTVLANGYRRAELKSVAVLFANIKGFIGFADRIKQNYTPDIIYRCLRVLDGSVYRYGGTVDKHLGDGLMALFGAPVAVERAAERAILAAMAMREGIKSINDTVAVRTGVPLSLRVGIDVGTVYFGEVDSTSEISAVGDVVNRAECIEEACSLNEILVNEPVKEIAGAFVYESAGEIRLSGREKTSTVWRVSGIIDPGKRWESLGASELMGRTGELSVIAKYLERAMEGGRAVVGISGQIGFGKSTAAAQVVRQAELAGMRTHLCECRPYTKSIPYHPLRPAFAKALGVNLPPEPEELKKKAKELFPESVLAGDWLTLLFAGKRHSFTTAMKPEEQLYNIRELGARLLEETDERTVLLVIDDFDWTDEATRDFLSHAKERPGGGFCVLLTASGREALTEPTCDEIIEFGPLDGEILTRVVLDTYPGMSDGDAAAVAERADGNPLYALELARSISRGESIPESIRLLIQVRLDGLEKELRGFLKAAAVLGSGVKNELLENILDIPDEFPMVVNTLAENGLIKTREGRVEFANELVRDITFNSVVRDEKEFIANRALGVLDEVYKPESLDWLLHRAVYSELAGRRGDAGGYFAKLGALAHESLSFKDAEEYFGRAVTYFGDASDYRPARVAVQVERAKNLVDADEYEKARILLEDEFREDDSADLKAAVVMGIGRCYYREGRNKEALVYYEDAEHLLREFEDFEAKAELAHLRSVALYHLGRFAGAIGNAEIALGMYRTLGNKDEEAAALNVLGIVNLTLRRTEQAAKHFNAALDLWRETDNRFGMSKTLHNLGSLCTISGIKRFAQAEELLKESLSIAEDIGSRWMILRVEASLANVCAILARFREAEERAKRALATAEEIDDVEVQSGIISILARVAIDNKDYDKAQDYCSRAYYLAVKTGGKVRRQSTVARWASLLAEKPDASEEEFREKVEELKGVAYLAEYKEMADTLEVDRALATGRPLNALKLIEEIEVKYPEATESTRLFLAFHKGMALLGVGELSAAEECLLTRYRASDEPEFPKLLAAYFLARIYNEKKEYEKANRYLEEARKAFEDGGAEYWVGVCEKLSRQISSSGANVKPTG
jgi:adenylate cyclase